MNWLPANVIPPCYHELGNERSYAATFSKKANG